MNIRPTLTTPQSLAAYAAPTPPAAAPAPAASPALATPAAAHDMTILSTHPSGAPKEVVLPADRPHSALSGTKMGTFCVGGALAGGMATSYVALTVIPMGGAVAAGVFAGGALIGGLMGYFASRPEHPKA